MSQLLKSVLTNKQARSGVTLKKIAVSQAAFTPWSDAPVLD